MVTQKVKADLNVLGFGMKHGVLSNTNGTRAITEKRHSSEVKAKVSQGGDHPKQLGTASGSSYILGLCGGLGYT